MYTTTYNPYAYDVGFYMGSSIMPMLSLAIQILALVAICKTYAKLGLEWWSALIPVYNIYILAKKLWDDKNAKIILWLDIAVIALAITAVFMILLLVFQFVLITSATTARYAQGIGATAFLMLMSYLAMIGCAIALLVWEIRLYSRLSKKFGHGDGFTVGLIFLPVIFFSILAFSEQEKAIEETEEFIKEATE